jgi:hypothetical protein
MSPPGGAEARLGEVKAETAALDQSMDKLEERLVGSQAQLQLWQELQRRHRRVSMVVTQNHTAHVAQISRLLERQEEKSRRRKSAIEVAFSASRSRPVVSKRQN